MRELPNQRIEANSPLQNQESELKPVLPISEGTNSDIPITVRKEKNILCKISVM